MYIKRNCKGVVIREGQMGLQEYRLRVKHRRTAQAFL